MDKLIDTNERSDSYEQIIIYDRLFNSQSN